MTHELARDIIMIGRALLNHIVIDHPDGVSTARRSFESPRTPTR